jgi:hypothetical protein
MAAMARHCQRLPVQATPEARYASDVLALARGGLALPDFIERWYGDSANARALLGSLVAPNGQEETG